MVIRRADILDTDIYDVPELSSDGYSIYLSGILLVSTTALTKTIIIQPISDGEGLLCPAGDHPVQSGDKVFLYNTNTADGYYIIGNIINNITFTVTNEINNSTGGYINFIYPSGASNIGFYPGALTSTRATNIQDAITDAHVSITTLQETTIDPFSHETLRQLIHFIDEGPGDGFASNAYKEVLPNGSPFPTNMTWYVDSSKTQKIVEKTLTLNTHLSPITITWKVYKEDGLTVAHQIIDTISYSTNGVFEISRVREIN